MPIIIFIVIFLMYVSIASCCINNSMTKDGCKQYGKGSFEDFLREFKNVEWDRDENHPKSFFNGYLSAGNYIHAGIRKFNGKGMTMNWWNNLRFVIFLERNKYKVKRNSVKWKI